MDVSRLEISTDTRKKRIINDQYRILRKIGQGQSGKVLLAERVIQSGDEDKLVAIKTINRIDKTKLITKTYLSHMTKIKREIQIMKECNHPNVVKLYSVIDDLKYDKILLVLEYCSDGEIDWKRYNHYTEKLKNGRGLTINKILRDVVNGLEYLHEYKGIIHRDLKPSNLLIQGNSMKITDFGVSLILENNANDAKELGKTMGTPAFFCTRALPVYIWSLGVILYCLIFNDLPFNGKNEFGLFKNIVTKDLKFPQTRFSSKFTESDRKEFNLLCDLISKILVKDPNHRYTIQNIKDHSFTTFDLTMSESLRFKRFNDGVIHNQLGLTNKIKKFFGGKPMESVNPIKIEHYDGDYNHLEPVDDLLDSYFDSSSMGSMESDDDGAEDIQPIAVVTGSHESIEDKKVEFLSNEDRKDYPLGPDRLFASNRLSERVQAPPSLNFTAPRRNTLSSPVKIGTSTPLAPVSTPLSASPSLSSSSSMISPRPVTLGPSSPSTSVFYSPTRSFFDKIHGMNHTISSLSSPPDTRGFKSKDVNDKLDLEPPNIFGSRHSSVGSVGSSHRKNSFGSPLMRITSSSSSLNLNAYLTDDNFSINLRSQDESDTDSVVSDAVGGSDDEVDDEADSTFVYGEVDTNINTNTNTSKFKFQDMGEYLDRLD
ncbi:kinase-like protein [Yamadazyma tenuis ATCC 10573]|uniref:Kinase-like protein n=1 Tax=Candida tenuis (strain ATCC 10573 / BCRC 21748 / CBS 615 / JCM 9827 / NBRC 10315 / NRRL Y-1498 / VKM Y-70) TaxID=590646 RepID=G3AZD0_CANTC|nr:kinase-like protein [Yamadazyma tenuis ATCC 10573]EGV66065.1 kinase-like protein [Yamadazyma tenuis ATCC 10573]